MVGIGVDLGPRSGVNVRFGVDPNRPYRMCLRSGLGGCSRIVGAILIFAGGAMQASSFAASHHGWLLPASVVIGMMGGVLLFAVSEIVLDRRSGLVKLGLRLWIRIELSRESLKAFSTVLLRENESSTTDSDGHVEYTTTFDVALAGDHTRQFVASAGIWENAVPVAEALSRFLSLPLEDRAIGGTRQPDELDIPLCRQSGIIGKRKWSGTPKDLRSNLIVRNENELEISIPRPDGRALLAVVVFTFVLWTLPVGLISRSLFVSLLPLVITLGSWIKVAFGYSSTIVATPETLVLTTRGLLRHSTTIIPNGELENLLIRRFEWGGPRNALAMTLDGVLIARSDRAVVRFGHGLSTEELQWLRFRLLAVVASTENAGEEAIPQPRELRRLRSGIPLVVSWAVGVAVAHVIGGPLGVCLNAPFLEHVVSVGSVVGLLLGVLSRGRLEKSLTITGGVVIALMLFAVIVPDSIQPGPSFDEISILNQSDRPREFWLGWLPAFGVLHSVLAALFLPGVVRGVRWCARRGHPLYDHLRQRMKGLES